MSIEKVEGSDKISLPSTVTVMCFCNSVIDIKPGYVYLL